jgi:hypothetical protein
MDSGGDGASASPWPELYRLERVLAQLTRPTVPGAGVPPALRDQLRALGVQVPRAVRRESLIAEVWGRKRPLLRRLIDFDDPDSPCA